MARGTLRLVLACTLLSCAGAAKARRADRGSVDWQPWEAETFERARSEGRYLLVDCAAEWCHWCHVMDDTTYRDPRVLEALEKRFVAVKVDIDARPDLAERYGEWGWPATIVLSPDAQELGKFRGYLPPERLLEQLGRLDGAAARATGSDDEAPGIAVNALGGAVKHALERLDFFWDERDGSWGLKRKVPIGMNVVWELTAGNSQRGLYTLEKQRALLDPVWGGIYQYSAAEDWNSPHYEKLMTYQAPNLEAYALGAAFSGRADFRAASRGIVGYIAGFLTAPDGTFYVNQDADLNAHQREQGFVEGKLYYAKADPERRALGLPWVDTHVYARENGLALAALVASGDLDRARRAANVLVRTHLTSRGQVKHDPKAVKTFFLADAAALGLGFARLAEATGDVQYAWAANRIAQGMLESFGSSGALYDSTSDPEAAGVFARRQKPFVHNVVAARLLAAVGMKERGLEVLAGISSTARIDAEGAWLGEYLLAAKELGAF
ncbi:MAG: thioredoxin domain-containing protein [Archangiaceae bacterium]|nr:thioredoxin domain-containing protein [Archangiaceae bacterium]